MEKMKNFAFHLLLMTCIGSSYCSESNLTKPEVPVEVPISSEDDSEQELSLQLQEINIRSGGWTSWSQWSACSRSCDGGVSHQLRACKTGSCRGEHVRYKICNMQAITVLLAVLAATNASTILAPSAKILQGPSSRTTVIGNDGSAISSIAPGGSIITEEHPGLVAHTAPAVVAHAAPVVATHSIYGAPVLAARTAPVLAHSAPLTYATHGALDTLVAGPSGTIATSRSVAAPALLSHRVAPLVYTSHVAPLGYARHVAPLAYARHNLHGFFI